MLPDTKPTHAVVQWQDRTKKPVAVEVSFEADDSKQCYELRIFDNKRARIERHQLVDFNEQKARYMTILPAEYRDIDGQKSVNDICAEFLQAARSITLRPDFSSYKTDCYYA